MPEQVYFYTLPCEEVEGFLTCIGGYDGLNNSQIQAMWPVYAAEGCSTFLRDLSANLKATNPVKHPITGQDRVSVNRSFYLLDKFRADQWTELHGAKEAGVPYCILMTMQTEYLRINRIEEEQKGLWNAIKGTVSDAIDGVKNFLKDNLSLVIIAVIVALTAVLFPAALTTIAETIWTILKSIGIATAKTLSTINGWITTVKTWLHIEEIGAIMQTVGSISRLLEIVSPTWAANIQKWENEIAKASKTLFGDANTISAYLTVVQMAVWDVSKLAGKPYDVFQIEWYSQATKIVTDIDRKQKLYQNNPGALWYDIQEWYLQPLYGEAVESRRASDVLVGQLALTADTLEGNITAIDRRLAEYEVVLKPTDLDGLKRSLGEIRRSLNEDAIEPLADFKKEVTDIYIGRLPDKSFSERWGLLVQPALDNANILGADEATLTDYQREQRLKKGENLLDFWSRVTRTAWDGVVSGVHRLYAETIGKLDRGEEIIPEILEYDPVEWKLIPSLLLKAPPFKRSLPPVPVNIPPVTRREAALSSLDPKIQSIQEKI